MKQVVDTTKNQDGCKNGESCTNDRPAVIPHVLVRIVHEIEQHHDEGDATQQHQGFGKIHICELLLFFHGLSLSL